MDKGWDGGNWQDNIEVSDGNLTLYDFTGVLNDFYVFSIAAIILFILCIV